MTGSTCAGATAPCGAGTCHYISKAGCRATPCVGFRAGGRTAGRGRTANELGCGATAGRCRRRGRASGGNTLAGAIGTIQF